MRLLTIILLSSCAKLGFPKGVKFHSSLKPNSNEGQEGQNNSNDIKRNVNYVIGGKEENNLSLEKNDKKDDISVDYSEAKSLLEIQAEEQKVNQKEHAKIKGKSRINVDYSESNTLLDFLKKEQEAIQKFERELNSKDVLSSDDNLFEYGYEKTIGGNEFFC